jgi:hypothetical protein
MNWTYVRVDDYKKNAVALIRDLGADDAIAIVGSDGVVLMTLSLMSMSAEAGSDYKIKDLGSRI